MSQDGSQPERAGGDEDLEARLDVLRTKLVAGLPTRADDLRATAAAIDAGEPSAVVDGRRVAHRLAGIAGSHGFHGLTDEGRAVERRIDDGAPPEEVRAALLALADSCDAVHRDPEAHRVVAVPEEQPAPTRRPSVLAIEDDEATAQLLALALRRACGLDATVLGSAEEALDLLERERFDLVLVDAMLPGMNGLEFTRRARRDCESARRIPIVVLSAASPEDLGWDLHSTEGTTPDGWLRKPIRATSFREELEPYLRASRALSR